MRIEESEEKLGDVPIIVTGCYDSWTDNIKISVTDNDCKFYTGEDKAGCIIKTDLMTG